MALRYRDARVIVMPECVRASATHSPILDDYFNSLGCDSFQHFILRARYLSLPNKRALTCVNAPRQDTGNPVSTFIGALPIVDGPTQTGRLTGTVPRAGKREMP
jgi:hypothetical protein